VGNAAAECLDMTYTHAVLFHRALGKPTQMLGLRYYLCCQDFRPTYAAQPSVLWVSCMMFIDFRLMYKTHTLQNELFNSQIYAQPLPTILSA
jgi:hypothetical protein